MCIQVAVETISIISKDSQVELRIPPLLKTHKFACIIKLYGSLSLGLTGNKYQID